MALIECTECGKQISDRSIACIHCGEIKRHLVSQVPLIFCKHGDIRNFTVQYSAQIIDRIHCNVAIFAQGIKCSGAKTVFCNQIILCNVLFL